MGNVWVWSHRLASAYQLPAGALTRDHDDLQALVAALPGEFLDDPRMLRLMERWSTVTRDWDERKMDRVLLAHVEVAG